MRDWMKSIRYTKCCDMKTYLLIIYNLMRVSLMKLRYGTRCAVNFIQRIHPSVDINLYNKSRIVIPRNIEIEKDADIKCFGNAEFSIGERCYFNDRLMVSCHAGVKIGDGCLFGPDVKIFDNDHVFSADSGVSIDIRSEPVTIGKHCWIASNVVILRGTHIGDNCVIGAGCVVSGNIPARSIVKIGKDSQEVAEIRIWYQK